MKAATPTLTIMLNVNCPHCDNYFDLLNDTDLNECGELLDDVCPTDGSHWSKVHETFSWLVDCPKCGEQFEAEKVEW